MRGELILNSISILGGIIASSLLVNYRLEQLEKKVDKHNSIIERTFILETKVANIEREVF